MSEMTLGTLARRASPYAASLVGALIIAYAVAVPTHDATRVRLLLYFLIACGIALAIRPEYFIGLTVLVFAVSSARSASLVSVGSAAIYVTDAMVLLVSLRAWFLRDRVDGRHQLQGLPQALFVAWLCVLALVSLRGVTHGTPFVSAIRVDIALVYYPLLYVGFTRIVRERGFDPDLFLRCLTAVALGLTTWMFLARALNHPFHDPGLAEVPTAPGQTVARNFGFASAFIIYPALALCGLAGMAYARTHRRLWTALAIFGTLATLLTLIRGAIFSLVFAAVLMFLLRPRSLRVSRAGSTILQVGLATVAAIVAIAAVSPNLGNGVIHRALPFTSQASGAQANAHYREKAVSAGVNVARQHPAGLGAQDYSQLVNRGIDPSYLAHSGVATLLIIGGWPALVLGVLLVAALIGRSFKVATTIPWLHAAFVAVISMLAFFSITSGGLAGEPWVIPFGALAVAIRYNLQRDSEFRSE